MSEIPFDLTEEQMEKLADGETIEYLIEKEGQWIDTLEIRWKSKGVYGDQDLEEAYPDVIGL